MPEAEFSSAEEFNYQGDPAGRESRGEAGEKERAEKLRALIAKLEEQLATLA